LTGNRVDLRGQGGVRRPERRRVGEDARGRQIIVISLRPTGFHPALDQRDLDGREPAHAVEVAVACDRLPRRHLPARDDLADLLAAGVRLLPAEEREGGDLARAMALLAVLLEQGRDVLGEGHGVARLVG
jgi:hypothetical protein